MREPLAEKVAWVAGVGEGTSELARGVGRAAALLLAARGARVLVSGAEERAVGACVGEIAHGGGQARHLAVALRTTAGRRARACVRRRQSSGSGGARRRRLLLLGGARGGRAGVRRGARLDRAGWPSRPPRRGARRRAARRSVHSRSGASLRSARNHVQRRILEHAAGAHPGGGARGPRRDRRAPRGSGRRGRDRRDADRLARGRAE